MRVIWSFSRVFLMMFIDKFFSIYFLRIYNLYNACFTIYICIKEQTINKDPQNDYLIFWIKSNTCWPLGALIETMKSLFSHLFSSLPFFSLFPSFFFFLLLSYHPVSLFGFLLSLILIRYVVTLWKFFCVYIFNLVLFAVISWCIYWKIASYSDKVKKHPV